VVDVSVGIADADDGALDDGALDGSTLDDDGGAAVV
jgi:hypothetical protein